MVLGNSTDEIFLSNTGLSPFRVILSRIFFWKNFCLLWTRNTPPKAGFRLLRFRSPLLTKSQLFSFPLVTWMFRFTRFPSGTRRYLITPLARGGIAPFGNQRLVMSVGGLTVVIALIHASFFGSNCQGIRHWHDFSHLSRLSIRR